MYFVRTNDMYIVRAKSFRQGYHSLLFVSLRIIPLHFPVSFRILIVRLHSLQNVASHVIGFSGSSNINGPKDLHGINHLFRAGILGDHLPKADVSGTQEKALLFPLGR